MNFENKVVLVTGASSGIGEATAILFSEYSARLALVGRNVENLNRVANICKQSKGIAPLVIVADFNKDEDVERVAKETIDFYGRLDVLVNNAGVGIRTTLQKTTMADYDKVMTVNLRAVYNLTRLLVKDLIKSKGSIINISSVASTLVAVGSLPYGMSKAALDHFTRLIALELGPEGVRVNSVNPGVTVTKFLFNAIGINEEQYEDYLTGAKDETPLKRVVQSREIADLVVYLASDLAVSITGTVIPVDAGFLLKGSSPSLVKQVK